MHVPDGFIDAPVSAATAVVAAGAVAVSLRGARRELDDKAAPLAGLVAAFIFAVQMLNFPVAAGTSGHLLGGALAAILVGPYTGVLCISVVLLMQGVLFADGGLTALGVNISVMGVVTTVVAYAVFRTLVKVLPRGRTSLTAASFAAALVSVPAAAAAFTLIYAVGGTTDVPVGKVFTAMVGVHALIGLGEAAITALTVSAVAAVRPDLIHGARDLIRPLELRTAPETSPRRDGDQPGRGGLAVPDGAAGPAASEASTAPGGPASPLRHDGDQPERRDPAVPDGLEEGGHRRAGGHRPGAVAADSVGAAGAEPAGTQASPALDGARPAAAPRSARRLWVAGLGVALVCAGGVSYYASSSPDGLEKVAQDKGIDSKAEEHAAKDSPLADYQVKDVADERISGGLAGVIGVGATLAVGTAVFVVVRRRRAAPSAESA
ncbi:energy-coupling factor ABC transporter permease [Streptomyces roseifaciens]|uniref:energy-coupling factor ABC transporter permease n=1 Tax=Streptomyces roseifaciens TaxID=1488406 RepID=UPI000718138E|nr:energy-coupling factor ABC transporter permease [Streptomyces roseifaciens]